MPTVLDAADRAALKERLAKLQPDSPRQWGSLTAPRMLCHLADSLENTFGDRPYSPVPLPLRLLGRLAKPLLLRGPMPRGRAQAPASMLVTQPGEWEADLARAVALLDRFATPLDIWPESAFFGHLTTEQVGVLNWKHFDHHLQQFGV